MPSEFKLPGKLRFGLGCLLIGLAASLCARLIGLRQPDVVLLTALCCIQAGLMGVWWIARKRYLREREELQQTIDELATEIRSRDRQYAEATAAMEEEIQHRSGMEEIARRQLERTAAIQALEATLRGRVDIGVTLSFYVRQMVDLLGAHAAAIYLCAESGTAMRCAASVGMTDPALNGFQPQIGEDIVGEAAEIWQVRSISDIAQSDPTPRLSALQACGYTDYLAVPLIANGQILGVLEIANRESLDTSAEAMEFVISMAAQTALALSHAALVSSLRQANAEMADAYDATILALSRALDLRDEGTEGHSQRVTQMTVAIAHALSIPDEEIVAIRRGALLHDIGKLGVPDSVLLKPGPLTPDERAVMQKHAVYAYEMLSPIAFLRPALDIPYCHHERWDGTGYPRGLSGEEIPLAARIFAIVDVWDALRSDRPYHNAATDEQVRRHLLAQAGIHFDPNLIEAAMAALFPESGLEKAA
jgi:putative nucleotidyltransferase with HDIG domain